ncbi:MAG: diguanylate cyclase [Bryobacterales bacterium]|nr:diguanylate cyclase [Bryobacterales bacterium]
MTDRSIRVLLVDGQVEDSRWVQELLAEFEESRFGGGWMHGIEVFHLERLADALAVLADNEREQYDAVLLNPNLPDSFGLHSYLRVQSQAPELPILILSELDDPHLAVSMVRAGAQDFLAKTQLDSLPLAKALRLAVERQRITRDLRSQCWRDELTGLLNRSGFGALVEQNLLHSRGLGLCTTVVVVDVAALAEIGHSYGKDEQQLALLDCAEALGEVTAGVSQLARVDTARFAFSLIRPPEASLSDLLTAVERRLHGMRQKPHRRQVRACFGVARWHDGLEPPADMLVCAEKQLCENVGDPAALPLAENSPFTFVARQSSL